MSWISSHKRRKAVLLTGALVLALGTGLPAAGTAAPDGGVAVATQAPGFPTFTHVPADQVAHPGFDNEWWYTVGHVRSGAHEYAYEVVFTKTLTQFAVTDITAGTFVSHQYTNDPATVSMSTTELDVRTPDGTLSGPLDAMRLTARLPDGRGSIDVTLNGTGPVIHNNGTGLVPFFGGSTYYYSLPDVRTSGTLTLNGRTSRITGTSWLDHQWGTWDWSLLDKWTWIGLRLDNGDYIDLFDIFDRQGENHWATVLQRDGSHRVVTVNPLAEHAGDFQTSPDTGQRYAGSWIVEIPSLRTRLTVTAAGPVLQELRAEESFTTGVNNAAVTVTGTYQGRRVTGKGHVEQLGNWR